MYRRCWTPPMVLNKEDIIFLPIMRKHEAKHIFSPEMRKLYHNSLNYMHKCVFLFRTK